MGIRVLIYKYIYKMIDDDYEFPEDSATYSDEEVKQKKTIDS